MRNTNSTKLPSINLDKLTKVTGGCGGGGGYCHRHRCDDGGGSVSVTVATGGATPQ